MNKDFIDNTLESFLNCVKNKKLVLFGIYDELPKAFPLFLDSNNIKPAYIVDNDYQNWYSHVCGCKVYEPAILKEESPGKIVVLITSIFPFRIKEQLERLGVVHYYSSVLLIEPRIGKQQLRVRF